MKSMTYKGYTACLEYSDEDDCFIGHIAGINDVIGFDGRSVSELHQAFEESVDDYLKTCQKLKREPQKPYSGKILLRISPEVHARVAIKAETLGKSLNAWLAEILEEAS